MATEVYDILKDRRTAEDIDKNIDKLFYITEELRKQFQYYGKDEFFRDVQLSALALNYYLELIPISEEVEKHYLLITTTLLNDRIEYHQEISRQLETKLDWIMDKSKVLYEKKIDDDKTLRQLTFYDNDDKEIKLFNSVHKGLNFPLRKNGYVVFGLIYMTLQRIQIRFDKLKNLRLERKDADYINLLHQFKDYYYLSEDWSHIKDNYLSKIFRTHRLSEHSTVEDIESYRDELYGDIVEDEVFGNIYDDEDETVFAKELVKLGLKTHTDIFRFFAQLGKIDVLNDWIQELKDNDLPYEEMPEEEETCLEVKFKEGDSEEVFKEKFSQIKEYMSHKKDKEWACVYHVLIYRNYIEDIEFIPFMRWLNKYSGDELISEENLRKVKSDYFLNTKAKWYFDEYKLTHDTNQTRFLYKKYTKICYDIVDILKQIQH